MFVKSEILGGLTISFKIINLSIPMNRERDEFEELSLRQKEILKYLINHYIANSEPVGSKTLSEYYLKNLSAATIRNVLEEMEEMGYLYKPHTSAGRIPTEKSFKFFVSDILKSIDEKHKEIDVLTNKIESLKKEKAEIFNFITRLLAELSHQTAIMLLPRFDYTSIKAVDFFKVSSNRALVVVIFEHSFVEHKVIELNGNYTQEQLKSYADHINRLLERRYSLAEIREMFLNEMRQLKELFDTLLENLNQKISADAVIVEGQSNLFDTPEFSDVKKMKKIFRLFEERGRIVSLLDSSLKAEGIKVFIGSEVSEELYGAAMVTAPYKDNKNNIGTLGILGPLRMDYAKILPLVISAANLLSRNLSNRN